MLVSCAQGPLQTPAPASVNVIMQEDIVGMRQASKYRGMEVSRRFPSSCSLRGAPCLHAPHARLRSRHGGWSETSKTRLQTPRKRVRFTRVALNECSVLRLSVMAIGKE